VNSYKRPVLRTRSARMSSKRFHGKRASVCVDRLSTSLRSTIADNLLIPLSLYPSRLSLSIYIYLRPAGISDAPGVARRSRPPSSLFWSSPHGEYCKVVWNRFFEKRGRDQEQEMTRKCDPEKEPEQPASQPNTF